MYRRRDRHHPHASPLDPARPPRQDPPDLDPHPDSDAFADLYAAFVRRVHAYALQRLRDDDLAADITSTVFTRALAAWSAFAPHGADAHGPSAVEGWLLTIARNAIIDHVRANRRLTILDADSLRHDLERSSPDPAGASVAPDERNLLLDALRRVRSLPALTGLASALTTAMVVTLLLGLGGAMIVQHGGLPGGYGDPSRQPGVGGSPGATPTADGLSCASPGHRAVIEGDVNAETLARLGETEPLGYVVPFPMPIGPMGLPTSMSRARSRYPRSLPMASRGPSPLPRGSIWRTTRWLISS